MLSRRGEKTSFPRVDLDEVKDDKGEGPSGYREWREQYQLEAGSVLIIDATALYADNVLDPRK